MRIGNNDINKIVNSPRILKHLRALQTHSFVNSVDTAGVYVTLPSVALVVLATTLKSGIKSCTVPYS